MHSHINHLRRVNGRTRILPTSSSNHRCHRHPSIIISITIKLICHHEICLKTNSDNRWVKCAAICVSMLNILMVSLCLCLVGDDFHGQGANISIFRGVEQVFAKCSQTRGNLYVLGFNQAGLVGQSTTTTTPIRDSTEHRIQFGVAGLGRQHRSQWRPIAIGSVVGVLLLVAAVKRFRQTHSLTAITPATTTAAAAVEACFGNSSSSGGHGQV